MSSVEEAYVRSLAVLRGAAHPAGFLAAAADPHYGAVWFRDAAVACLGASTSGEDDLVAAAGATLETMARLAMPRGQVPDAYWPDADYWDWGEAGTVDATAWFIVALAHHVEHTGRLEVARSLWPVVVAAASWLRALDVTGTRLVDSPAGGDWMDSTLNRSGRVFHVNVLADWATRRAAFLAAALGVDAPEPIVAPASIEGLFWPQPGSDLASLHLDAGYPAGATVRFPHPLAVAEHARLAVADRRHYLASVSYGRFVDRCDVLAHGLGIISGLITGERAATVLGYLDDAGCERPYPSRVWPVPFEADDRRGLWDAEADRHQDPRWRNPPGSYHNGAVWPYVGAVHAAAASVSGLADRAVALLDGVAAANRLGDPPWGFHEWIHAVTGRAAGARNQTWNAGAFVWAYRTVVG